MSVPELIVFGLFHHEELGLGNKIHWKIITQHRMSAIFYVASGGYSMPQLYPDRVFPLIKGVDRICDLFPFIFATRLLVVLEKKMSAEQSAAPDRYSAGAP